MSRAATTNAPIAIPAIAPGESDREFCAANGVVDCGVWDVVWLIMGAVFAGTGPDVGDV
jgi:hypothetical protein